MPSDFPPGPESYPPAPDGDDENSDGSDEPGGDQPHQDSSRQPAHRQGLTGQALRARVPDHIGDGCFSTGAIVVTGPSEFVIDFLQTIGRPHRVVKRVVVPHPVMPQFIEALRTNLELYASRFGPPPAPKSPQPGGDQPRKQTPQEIYDDLKMADNQLSGVYANGVMIGHGANEFGMDFLTSFFPQSAVSARVFLAAGQVPRLLDSLRGAVTQLQQRQRATPPGGYPGSSPDSGGEPDNSESRSSDPGLDDQTDPGDGTDPASPS